MAPNRSTTSRLFDPASPASAAARVVRSLGVTSGMSVAPDDGIPRLELAVMYGDAVDVDSIADAAETVAGRDDNRKKPAGAARGDVATSLRRSRRARPRSASGRPGDEYLTTRLQPL